MSLLRLIGNIAMKTLNSPGLQKEDMTSRNKPQTMKGTRRIQCAWTFMASEHGRTWNIL